MSFSIRKCCLRTGSNFLRIRNKAVPLTLCTPKQFSDKKSGKITELGSSTIILEDGANVQELPLIVRKLNDIVDLGDNNQVIETQNSSRETNNYPMIQEEFSKCTHLRDIFTLLSKCTKITPNIALGAMERIYELEHEKLSSPMSELMEMNVNSAKGAILDRLLNVIMKTEDIQTLLNALNAVSSFIEPYKIQLFEELLLRVTENKLNIEQLCEFVNFMFIHKKNLKFAKTIDKLWVGFAARENEINESNIVQVFNILPALKASKNVVLNMLEKKMSTLWFKIKPESMLQILEVFSQEKYLPLKSLSVIGRWTNTNIHLLNDDILLEILSKFTGLNYYDNQIEKAIERYIKAKGLKIESHMLIVGVLNYCLEFRLRNENILTGCSEFLIQKGLSIPPTFVKSFIYPFGLLNFEPPNKIQFWGTIEQILKEKISRITVEDMLDIILACIYLEKYPLQFTKHLFTLNILNKFNQSRSDDKVFKKLRLIDTAMSLECTEYGGPFFPKDNWPSDSDEDYKIDSRIQYIVSTIKDSLDEIAEGKYKISTSVLISYLVANELYVIDAMCHPPEMCDVLYLKLKPDRNVNTAILIHLPEHYCYGNGYLIGPQAMRKKHLKLLGFKVVSLNYNTIIKLRIHSSELEQYLRESWENAEPCL